MEYNSIHQQAEKQKEEEKEGNRPRSFGAAGRFQMQIIDVFGTFFHFLELLSFFSSIFFRLFIESL